MAHFVRRRGAFLGVTVRMLTGITMILPGGIHDRENPHLSTALALFPVDAAINIPKSAKFLFICFTNRCGSNFVAEAIGSDGQINVGGEYFNDDALLTSKFYGNRSLGDFVSELIRREGKNRSLSSKVSITQVALLARYRFLQHVINQSIFVFVERSDLLAQAISMQIAWQNQQWRASDSAKVDDAELVYSKSKIADTIADIAQQNALFQTFFGLNGIKPVSINYELFVAAPQHFLNAISEKIGVSLSYNPQRVKVTKQARAIHRTWRERYLAG